MVNLVTMNLMTTHDKSMSTIDLINQLDDDPDEHLNRLDNLARLWTYDRIT